MPSSPTAARLEFSLRIRARRQELGLSAESVAKAIGVSRVYFSSIENNRATLSHKKLPELCNALSIGNDDASALDVLLAEAKESGWWSAYANFVPEGFLEYVGLESSASSLSIYESRTITGLAQTREYARAIVQAAQDVRPRDLDVVVDLRMQRQDRLRGDDAPTVEVVLSETALVQVYGDDAVLSNQLEDLVRRIEDPASKMTVRVQPFSMTPRGLSSSTTIVVLGFESMFLPDIVWEEGGNYQALHVDGPSVSQLKVGFKEILESAFDEADSLALIKAKIRGPSHRSGE